MKNKAQEIKKLDEPSIVSKINESFKEWLNKFKSEKLVLMLKLKVDTFEIEKIKSELNGIELGLKNISNSSNLLESLNEDFEGLLESYDYINKTFKTALENSELRNDLTFLESIPTDGSLISNLDLDKNLSLIKRLLEYDLIKLNIIKNP